jgi:hypothetical protein
MFVNDHMAQELAEIRIQALVDEAEAYRRTRGAHREQVDTMRAAWTAFLQAALALIWLRQ